MAKEAVLPLFFGPAAVAIHNDCDVPWQTVLIDFLQKVHTLRVYEFASSRVHKFFNLLIDCKSKTLISGIGKDFADSNKVLKPFSAIRAEIKKVR